MNSILKKSLSFLMIFCMILFTFAFTISVNAAEEKTYVKVTSASTDWTGEYLIVYEAGNVIFDGSRTTMDATSNYKTVTISSDKITIEDGYYFTIDSNGYIKSASGYYIGQTSNANGLKSSTSTGYVNSISFNSSDSSINLISGSAYLRYNATSGQDRFRYYKSSSYTNQKAIHLYKLAANDPIINIIDPATTELKYTETLQLEAETKFFETAPTIIWEVSDSSIATIDDNGILTAQNKVGTVEVKAIATAGSVRVESETVTINVFPNVSTITVADAVIIANMMGSSVTEEEYTIVGTAYNLSGNTFYMKDETIDETVKFRAYNASTAEGVEQKVEEGDKVSVTGVINIYGYGGENPIPQFNQPTYSTYLNVVFDTGAEDITIDKQVLTPGSKAIRPENPVREGYNFIDWYNDNEPWNFDDEVKVHMTLTARWADSSKQQFNVTFDLNGGQGDITKNIIVVEGELVSAPDVNPLKEYATFLGWYNGDVLFDFENTLIDEDVTLTAKWYNYTDEQKGSIDNFVNTKTKTGLKLDYTETQETKVIDNGEYELITDTSKLKVGDIIVITATYNETMYALSTNQKSSNREAIEVSYDQTTGLFSENSTYDIQKIELVSGLAEGQFGFMNVNDNNDDNAGEYLYAASSSSNQLKTKASLDAHGSWNINADQIIATSSTNRNLMLFNYNSGTPLISCYNSKTTGTSYASLKIYKAKIEEVTVTEYDVYGASIRWVGYLSTEDYDNIVSIREEGINVEFGFYIQKGEGSVKYVKYNGNSETGLPYLNEGNWYELGLLLGCDKVDLTEEEKTKLIPSTAFDTMLSVTMVVKIGGTEYLMQYSKYSVNSLAQYYIDNLSSNEEIVDYLGILESIVNN